MNKLLYTDQILDSINRNASRPCFCIKRDGEYASWTYKEFGEDLNKITGRLKENDFK